MDAIEQALTRIAREQGKVNFANEALHEVQERQAQFITQRLDRLEMMLLQTQQQTAEILGLATHQVQEKLFAARLPDMVALVDNLHHAEQAAVRLANQNEAARSWADGLAQIRERAERVLAGWGIVTLSTPGMPFDPQCHEAVGVVDIKSGVPVIHEEVQRGYRWGDRVLRMAKVVVRDPRSGESGVGGCRLGAE